jgi:hypothetical protein
MHTTIASSLLKWGLMSYLPELASNCNTPNLSLPVARIIGMSYWHLVKKIFLRSSQFRKQKKKRKRRRKTFQV